jgi:hypothetical protein
LALTPLSTQDLMQHARRLARRTGPVGVSLVHLRASAYIMASAARYHYFRNQIGELARAGRVDLFELDAGRLCLVAEDEAMHGQLRRLLESEAAGPPPTILERFDLPAQYLDLRERLAVLASSPDAPRDAPRDAVPEPTPPRTASPPAEEPLSGPLTPALLARIQNHLDGVDLERFVRRQPVYARTHDWQPIYAEQVIDRATLAAACFPDVEVTPGEPLLLELDRHVDRLMLVALLLNRPWRRQLIGLDLGHAAWATDEYRRLTERLDDAERRRLTIEIDWLDALRDAATGGKVVAEMREAGFRIAIDHIGIDALPLLNLDRLDADWLKLVFDKTQLAALAEPAHLEALCRLDPDRLILTAADDKLALEVGQRLRIRHYQGTLIDRLARTVAASAHGARAAG